MMNRYRFLTALLAAGLCAGCGDPAQKLVAPDTGSQRVWLDLTGTGEQMVARRRIDAYRRIAAPDDVKLDVWVIKARQPDGKPATAKSRGTVVVIRGLAENTACFPYLGAGERLARKGYDVILPDLRHHGRSEGRYITFGVKEKQDVKAIVDALIKEGLLSPVIYAFGVNYGASVAIQYAAIDNRCAGIMAVAPYKDFSTYAARMLYGFFTMQQVDKAVKDAEKLAGFDADDASALIAARKLTCPLLLVHGLLDFSVPLEQSQAIYDAAAGPKKLLVPTADHLILPAIMEDWIADRIDMLAKTRLKDQTPPATQKSN